MRTDVKGTWVSARLCSWAGWGCLFERLKVVSAWNLMNLAMDMERLRFFSEEGNARMVRFVLCY